MHSLDNVDRYSLANGASIEIHFPQLIAREEAEDLLIWLGVVQRKIERAARARQEQAAAGPAEAAKPDWLLQREKLAEGLKDRIVQPGKPDPIYQQAWDRLAENLHAKPGFPADTPLPGGATARQTPGMSCSRCGKDMAQAMEELGGMLCPNASNGMHLIGKTELPDLRPADPGPTEAPAKPASAAEWAAAFNGCGCDACRNAREGAGF